MATILVVDDDPLICRVFARVCAEHRVIGAGNYAEAVGCMLIESAVDAVISDLRMPGRSGVSVLRMASVLQPQTVRVLLSAAEPEGIDRLLRTGMIAAHFSKPADLTQLRGWLLLRIG